MGDLVDVSKALYSVDNVGLRLCATGVDGVDMELGGRQSA